MKRWEVSFLVGPCEREDAERLLAEMDAGMAFAAFADDTRLGAVGSVSVWREPDPLSFSLSQVARWLREMGEPDLAEMAEAEDGLLRQLLLLAYPGYP